MNNWISSNNLILRKDAPARIDNAFANLHVVSLVNIFTFLGAFFRLYIAVLHSNTSVRILCPKKSYLLDTRREYVRH